MRLSLKYKVIATFVKIALIHVIQATNSSPLRNFPQLILYVDANRDHNNARITINYNNYLKLSPQ